MTYEKLSTAQRRAKRIRENGGETGDFDFNYEDVQSLESYYDISLSFDEIASIKSEYSSNITEVEEKFLKHTKFNKLDLSFLFLAIALQCTRQYVLTTFKDRDHHEKTKKEDKKKENETYEKVKDSENNNNKQGGYYYTNLEDILKKGVPYDIMAGSKKQNLGGENKGIYGGNHRCHTLGHDPILGWVIGPMNIMTKTLTTAKFESYHIRRKKNARGHGIPYIYSKAKNKLVIDATLNRMNDEPVALAAAIIKQAIHFKSDVNTKESLPLPIISAISPDFAKELAKYGLDSANVANIGKQATFSILINSMIAMIHRLFYDESKHVNKKLYEVKTRKILMYSNTIASTSNLLYVALSGDTKKLDIGGMLVTIYRIVKDEKFISDVMDEFINTEVSKVYKDELEKTDMEFDKILAESGIRIDKE